MNRLIRRLLSRFRKSGRFLSARYDAAAFNAATARHWFPADTQSANAAASPQVRKILRARARYEVANNPTAAGIALKLANDLVGTGPRLQLYLSEDRDGDAVETQWQDWAETVQLAAKLRTARIAQFQDGEAFLVLITNPRLDTPVKLDLRVIEADRVTEPQPLFDDPLNADGIRFDKWGNPIDYAILRQHPGDSVILDTAADRIPASQVIHLFRPTRPEQQRGIPELTPALPLFAILRDWTIATVDAAKLAATIAGVIYTDAPPGGEPADLVPLDPVTLERNALITMPGGWKVDQMDAKQPAGNFAEGKVALEKEAIRCTLLPWNVAASDSSSYNYASGRLDHQTYWRALSVERSELERRALRPILRAWFSEAALIPDYLPAGYGPPANWKHAWFWDGQEHVDPVKEAAAQAQRLANCTTTWAAEYARQGKDWKLELAQRAKELAYAQELGLLYQAPNSPVMPSDEQ